MDRRSLSRIRTIPSCVAEYAGRVAERFQGRVFWYTPLNEPRITAWYCGKLGWWPPYRRGWRGFVAVMLAVCPWHRANGRSARVPSIPRSCGPCRRNRPLRNRRSGARRRGAAATGDRLSGARPRQRARRCRGHPLYGWLIGHGATRGRPRLVSRARDRPPARRPEPLSHVHPEAAPARRGRAAADPACPTRRAISSSRLGRLYFERYGAPLFISETASLGSVAQPPRLARRLGRRRPAQLRQEGVPVIGYTWWPMFALVAWAYRQGRREPAALPRQMGLWDIDPVPAAALARVPTPLVDAYRDLIAGGTRAVGRLSQGEPRFAPEVRVSGEGIARCFAASSWPVSRARPATTGMADGSTRWPRPGTIAPSTSDYRELAALGIRAVREVDPLAARRSRSADATISRPSSPSSRRRAENTASRSSGISSTTATRSMSTSGATRFPERFAEYCYAAARYIARANRRHALFHPGERAVLHGLCGRREGAVRAARRGARLGAEGRARPRRHRRHRRDPLDLLRMPGSSTSIRCAASRCPPTGRPELAEEARDFNDRLVFQSWDMLSGRLMPELGGTRDHLDIVGINYYWTNQWEWRIEPLRDGTIPPLDDDDPRRMPLRDLVRIVWDRYGGDLMITETSHVGDKRGPWLRRGGRGSGGAAARGRAVCTASASIRFSACPNGTRPDDWTPMGLWDPVSHAEPRGERVSTSRCSMPSASAALDICTPRARTREDARSGQRRARRA